MDPSFDTWTSGFLFGSVMGIFLFVLLLTSRNKKNYPIAYLILAFSLILSQYVLYWTGYNKVYPYFNLIPTMCYYVTGPLLYIYFLNLYKREINFNYASHFFPAFLMLIPNIVIVLKYLSITSMKIPFMFFILNQHWFISIHMIVYTLLSLNLIQRNKQLDTEYHKVRYNWATVLLSLYSLFIVSYISYYVLRNLSFFSDEWDYMISIMMTVSIYTIGYFIFKQPSVFDGELFSNLFLPIKNKNESFESSLLNEFYENVTNYMENQKPYIDNELRLVNLADKIGFSTHLLSKVINKKSGKNFNNFINEYRLKEAEKLLLTNTDNHNIKTIYFDVGFNNKTSFYKAFKKKYKCTPSEYISRKNLSLE